MSFNANVTFNGKKYDLLSVKVNINDKNKMIDDLIEALTTLKKGTSDFFEKTQTGRKNYRSLFFFFFLQFIWSLLETKETPSKKLKHKNSNSDSGDESDKIDVEENEGIENEKLEENAQNEEIEDETL